MNDQSAAALGILVVMFVALIALSIWGTLIYLGIRAARKRNRSPHWMWFGIHPMGALIACIVMHCLSPLQVCPQCKQKSQPGARVCPFCSYSFQQPAPMATAAANRFS